MYPQLIQEFLESEQLPSSYGEDIANWVLPVFTQLKDVLLSHQDNPFFLGINGAQGTGKSTLNKLICLLAENEGLRVASLSIDDFYLSKADRSELAKSVHPLLATRGVPGTHDIALLKSVIATLRSSTHQGSISLPSFDKAIDDRVDEAEFKQQTLPVDLILLEGWCVGARAQPEKDLKEVLNQLEAIEDPQCLWRNYVNDVIRDDYEPLFDQLDCLFVLQAPSFEQVLAWRGLQEEKLRRNTAGEAAGIMNDRELQRFIQHYERITRSCLEQLPKVAGLVFRLDEMHRFTAREDQRWQRLISRKK